MVREMPSSVTLQAPAEGQEAQEIPEKVIEKTISAQVVVSAVMPKDRNGMEQAPDHENRNHIDSPVMGDPRNVEGQEDPAPVSNDIRERLLKTDLGQFSKSFRCAWIGRHH